MKSLHRLALSIAAAAFLVAPAFAATGPADVPMPDPLDLVVVDTAPAVSPLPAHNVCMFAIVEDLAACTISVSAVTGECPQIVARVIGAMGVAAIATPAFAAACAGPPLPD